MSACALVLTSLARADALEFPVSIAGGPLPAGLKDLQLQTGIELLYDGDVVRAFRAPGVSGHVTTEMALLQLLAESDLSVRRAASGAWIIERPSTPPLAQQDAAVAEILVVGRRTQNADIRRFEDDVQPYTVATRERIVRAHRDNIDQFFSSRITTNTTIIPSIASQDAGVRSSINLRGLGELDTVVLVDGRRMPSIPAIDTGFMQPDLNAIPLHAIERIEVLTGAAGGIHGFGALGGVVNIVLDRDIDGLDLFTTQGISSRGDSRRRSVEARFGRTFREGATDFVLFASRQELDTVRVMDREFAVRDRRRTHEYDPERFSNEFPSGHSVTVSSLFGFDPVTSEFILNPDLTFKPEFGGGALGSNLTYLPIGFSGDGAALAAALERHAGEIDFSLPDNEARNDLGSNPHSDALFANLRHRFGSGWEAYADVVRLRNRGESIGPANADLSSVGNPANLWNGVALMAPESPANPFTDYISLRYPILGVGGRASRRIDNTRYTAGVEGELPFDWRGTVEASWGRLHHSSSVADGIPLAAASLVLLGDPSDLETNPLGDWETFNRIVQDGILRSRLDTDTRTRFRAQSLRLAGPVFATRVAPSTLTVLAERRSERVLPGKEVFFTELGPEPSTNEFREDPRSRATHSYYGELRSRVFDETARVPMLRGLELQLAVRHDEQEDDFQRTVVFPDPGFLHTRFSATAYTVGAKISPTRWLMLRGSYATGEQPPPMENLVEMDPFTIGTTLTPDPKRGDTLLGDEGDGVMQVGGNSKLKSARVSTFFFGAMITPAGPDGPRFAIDYSHIRRARDVVTYDLSEIIAQEDEWPERVARAPLTDADRANGYTGGVVEMIDVRDTNDGTLEVDAFDLRAEWPLSFLGGRLRLYVDATYHKRNVQKARTRPDISWAGYLEGPLQRRANGGFDWSKGSLTLGANLQYFGSSLIFDRDVLGLPDDEEDLRIQGSPRIPSQTYLDLFGSWRLSARNPGWIDSVTFDVGIVNVLDKAPPRVNSALMPGPGYSRYGDPRLRRFELGLSCHF